MYSAQSTNDSVEIAKLKDSIEYKEKSVINYAKKIEQLRSKRMHVLLLEMKPLKTKLAPASSKKMEINNIATRLEQYDVFFLDERYKVEYVPRTWFGRLLNKQKYKLKLTPIEKDTIINH